jgi:hypothetical protein
MYHSFGLVRVGDSVHHATQPSGKNKNRSNLTQEGWNGSEPLFLPSTVLTASGSRGLGTLPIFDCRLSIVD